ncbi:phosphotransferase enzyme family protein [Streptomyces acidiscabies]|uniref:Phosphotransferase n=1 Tax=Streptomyces acidiscabies TaxID=42234 RepID=A0ABU4MCH2_9ACTN|nr:phosphotransferase [Streptomyces acidiscabies]MDX3025804.1 phosphotransferase [Streptomyces acidiscabies]
MNTAQADVPLTGQAAAGLLDAYGLTLERARPLPGGMENTHVKAQTTTGTVVVTVLNKKTVEQAGEYARFLRHLELTGAPAPRLRALRDGSWVTQYGGWPVIVCDFVDGRSPARLPARLVHEAGLLLGRVHGTAAAGFDSTLHPHLRLDKDDAATLASLPDSAFGRWARSTWHAVGHVPEHDGPLVPVHGDLFPDNIIVPGHGRSLVFLDWEDGSLDLPHLDVGMALLGLCCRRDFSPRRARHLLAGYQQGSQGALNGDLVRDAALYAAVLVALRRHRWQQEHRRLPTGRSAAAMHHLAASLADRWPQLQL